MTRLLFVLMSWTPLRLLRLLSGALGMVGYAASARRRRIARVNLRLAYAREAAWRVELRTLLHFVALLQSLADRAWLWRCSADTVKARVRIEGAHLIPKDTPVILLVPHLAGLDAGWTRLAIEGLPMTTLYQPQRNKIYDAMIHRYRLRHGDVKAWSRHEGIRKTLADMKAGRLFYCLPDMDFGPKDALFVPLFGQPAATVTVVPKLARLAHAVVVPIVTRMTAAGYEVRVQMPWSGLDDLTVEQACRRMNAAVEGWAIDAGPEYLWSHRRYKTRPEGAAPLY
jgi:Kdo2-lipid IVA lauroyltransferase/acyltransferase